MSPEDQEFYDSLPTVTGKVSPKSFQLQEGATVYFGLGWNDLQKYLVVDGQLVKVDE